MSLREENVTIVIVTTDFKSPYAMTYLELQQMGTIAKIVKQIQLDLKRMQRF